MKTPKAKPEQPEPQVHTIFGIDPGGHALMRVKEVATALNQRQQFVYDRIDEGEIHALRRPGSRNSNFSIVRASVIAYLARSAQGVDERDYAEALLFLFKRLPPDLRRTALHKMQEVSPA